MIAAIALFSLAAILIVAHVVRQYRREAVQRNRRLSTSKARRLSTSKARRHDAARF